MSDDINNFDVPGSDGGTPSGGEKKHRKKLGTLDKILLIAAAVLFIAGVVLTLRQYVFIPGEYTAPPTATPTELTPTPQLETTATPEPTPTPVQYAALTPVNIYFTQREVMCPIEPVGLITEGSKTGKMDTIDDPKIAAWYEPGPVPGEAGNALLNGHVRWKGVAGTFSVLPDMEIGEEVVIEYDDGSTLAFEVTSVEYYPYDDVPEEVMDLDFGGTPRMTLISCTGDFNYSAGTSSQRVIVVCNAKGE